MRLHGWVRGLFGVAGVAMGFAMGNDAWPTMRTFWTAPRIPLHLILDVFAALVGGLVGFAIGRVIDAWEASFRGWLLGRLSHVSAVDAVAGAGGTIVGLGAGALLSVPASSIPDVGAFLAFALTIVFGYAGLLGGIRLREQLPGLEALRASHPRSPKATAIPKVLDTSVIIDGRIADLCRTGFLEGPLVVPGFVLDELRHIADSSDALRRNRGRRGLDVLARIQRDRHVQLQVVERDAGNQTLEVDVRLLRLARQLAGKVVTNDFNLNKVAQVQGVPVLNINELANAVKPVVLPGEEMVVRVIKDGKESGQGVGYLDDGTMIVVDGGKRFIGNAVGVQVTSVLQTAAGRMIFARPKGPLAGAGAGASGASVQTPL